MCKSMDEDLRSGERSQKDGRVRRSMMLVEGREYAMFEVRAKCAHQPKKLVSI